MFLYRTGNSLTEDRLRPLAAARKICMTFPWFCATIEKSKGRTDDGASAWLEIEKGVAAIIGSGGKTTMMRLPAGGRPKWKRKKQKRMRYAI